MCIRSVVYSTPLVTGPQWVVPNPEHQHSWEPARKAPPSSARLTESGKSGSAGAQGSGFNKPSRLFWCTWELESHRSAQWNGRGSITCYSSLSNFLLEPSCWNIFLSRSNDVPFIETQRSWLAWNKKRLLSVWSGAGIPASRCRSNILVTSLHVFYFSLLWQLFLKASLSLFLLYIYEWNWHFPLRTMK